MRTGDPRERRAAHTMESFSYDSALSRDMAPMTSGFGGDDENGGRLSSSQVEIVIEKGLQIQTCPVYVVAYPSPEVDPAQFQKRFISHLEEQASACTPHMLIGFETRRTYPPELSDISADNLTPTLPSRSRKALDPCRRSLDAVIIAVIRR